MRPPSYYTSLANSNRSSTPAGFGSSALANSSQLRSSFASSSSSSYVTRSHLPYVSQSMLVAHCITGSGSSTKPYGHASGAYKPTSYSATGAGYHSTLSGARPQSTKRLQASTLSHKNPYLAPASPAIKSSYLSSSSSSSYSPTTRTATSYTPRPSITSSSYYKPIRLRERPLLTQISRQLNSEPSKQHSRSKQPPAEPDREEPPPQPVAEGAAVELKERDDWQSDVARNISRNKYLIKFREIDKPRGSLQPVSQANTGKQTFAEQKTPTTKEAHFEGEAASEEQATMKLPAQVERIPELVVEKKCDQAVSLSGADESETKKKPREKRNIKLKIKNLREPEKKSDQVIEEAVGKEPVQAQIEEKAAEPIVRTKKTSPKEEKSAQLEETREAAPVVEPTAKVPKAKKLVKATSASKLGASLESSASEAAVENASSLAMKKKKKTEARRGSSARKPLGPRIEANGEQLEPRQVAPPVGSKSADATPNSADLSPSASANRRIRFRQYSYDDFNFLSVLGHGGWGFVILAELKQHDACFAVKCIKKITIVEDDDFDSIMIERKVLTLGNVHPFICKLFCTFETDGYLFFVMEYCAGGDLMFHVQKEGKFSESRCRFYAAEIICAIRFLHNRHIIYRDLKLDNILLDEKGHIRLVDFGMCQCRTYREEMLPSNFCGTPEYISPEIIKGVPYNHSVDWWSFGVLLYEMAIGKMPFRGQDENELLWNVCYEQIHYPMFLTKELTNLLQLLLEREPTKRMGMATCKAGDIYEQPWFRNVDWRAIEELRVEPPFVPEVDSKRDTRNFDADFTQSTPELSPVDAATLARIDQDQFQKFPYTNPNIFIFD